MHIDSLISLSKHDVQVLQLVKQLTLVRPHVEFLHQFWHNEEGAPSPDFLRLQNITENVITNVQHILSFGLDELGEHIARSARVNVSLFQRPRVGSYL